MSEIELKPCPFCISGGEPYLHQVGNEHTKERGCNVGCNECKFVKQIRVIRYSVEWAIERGIEQWNTRPDYQRVIEKMDSKLDEELAAYKKTPSSYNEGWCDGFYEAIAILKAEAAITKFLELRNL